MPIIFLKKNHESQIPLGVSISAISGACARQCQNITIPVSITGQNSVLNLEPLLTGLGVTDFILDLSQQDGTFRLCVVRGVSL